VIFDDEPVKKIERVIGAPLDRLSVDELQEYVDELNVEIERVQTEISRKSTHKSSADALFRKNDG